ncbi:MAG: hypothetical protein V4622_09050 [Bacteroidota bacterium]
MGLRLNTPFWYRTMINHSNWSNYGLFVKRNGALEIKKDFLDLGLKVNLKRVIARNCSIGLEAEFELFSTIYNYNTSGNLNLTETKHQKLNFFSTTLMPSIEFSSRSSIQPIGISQEFGFGITQSSLILKDYLVSGVKQYYDSNVEDYVDKDTSYMVSYNSTFSDLTKNKFHLFLIQYAVNFKKPLSQRLILNYGLSYNIRFYSYRMRDLMDQSKEYTDYGVLAEEMRKKLIRSFMHFKIGLSYTF